MILRHLVSNRPIAVKIGSCLVIMGLIAGGIAAAGLSGTDRLGTMVDATDVATGILVKTSSVSGHIDALLAQTGGRKAAADAKTDLKDAGDIVEELSNQYLLSYASSNDKRDGTWRKITVDLTDKRYPVKSAAQTTLVAMGLPGLPAVLEGLGSDSVDVRLACLGPATTVTKNGKLAKDVTFWKSGKADDRAKALTEWKAWAEAQNKPRDKDAPPAKK